MFTNLLEVVGEGTKAYVDRQRVAGLGTLSTKPEGTSVSFDDPVSGARVRSVFLTYALGWRATMEALEDELFNVFDRMSAELAMSVADHKERLAWSMMNDGFAGTTFTGLESEALYSTTHSLIKTGGTASNSLSPAIALNQTGLETILSDAHTTLSDEGRFNRLSTAKLLYHPDLAHRAYELLNTEFKPGSGDNDRSTVASTRTGMTPVVDTGVPYMTNVDGWSVHGVPGENSLTFGLRKGETFGEHNDADTFDKKFYAHYRAIPYFNEWRNNFGSNV